MNSRFLLIFDISELLLLGTGKSLVPLPPTIRKYLQQIGVQTDVMDTVSQLGQCDLHLIIFSAKCSLDIQFISRGRSQSFRCSPSFSSPVMKTDTTIAIEREHIYILEKCIIQSDSIRHDKTANGNVLLNYHLPIANKGTDFPLGPFLYP